MFVTLFIRTIFMGNDIGARQSFGSVRQHAYKSTHAAEIVRRLLRELPSPSPETLRLIQLDKAIADVRPEPAQLKALHP